jgi:non-ribosomal peptide synthetase component F
LSSSDKDFAIWQRNYLTGERLKTQLSFWEKKLDGYERLDLVSDNIRPTKVDYCGEDVQFELDEATSDKLRTLAKKFEVSLYSLLLSAYYLLLRVYSNQDDIVIGTPVSNRHYNQVENLIGFFLNSLAIRVKIKDDENLADFVKRVGREAIEAQINQDLPFEKLVEQLKVEKDQSRHPIFQVMFGVQSFGSELVAAKNLLEPYEAANASNAKFDISTFIDDSSPCIKGGFTYASNLYKASTIDAFIETYKMILMQFAELADKKQVVTKISDLAYLNKEQFTQIIHAWNKTDCIYPTNKTIHELFEEQVRLTPNNVAVIYEDTKLTYKELNQKANQLAVYLKVAADIHPDTLVAICLNGLDSYNLYNEDKFLI